MNFETFLSLFALALSITLCLYLFIEGINLVKYYLFTEVRKTATTKINFDGAVYNLKITLAVARKQSDRYIKKVINQVVVTHIKS